MTDTTSAVVPEVADKPVSPWQLRWLWGILIHPNRTLLELRNIDKRIWLLPVLLLCALASVQVMVNAPLKIAALEQTGVAPGPNSEFLTPEQQAQLQQSLELTRGPVFQYVFPIAGAIIGTVLIWSLTAALLHLFATLQGGRGTMTRTLNLAAWASVPLMLQLLVQIIYVLATKKLLVEPGLGGFAPPAEAGLPLVHAVLSRITLYFVWNLILLAQGIKLFDTISLRKAWVAVLVSVVIVMALRVLPELLGTQLRGLTVTQPFGF